MTLRRDPTGDAETTVEFICNADQRCQIGVDQNGRLGKDRDAPAIGTADAPPALGRAGKLAPGNYELKSPSHSAPGTLPQQALTPSRARASTSGPQSSR